MPNAISAQKKSVTYLEQKQVHDWMLKIAAERKTDVSVILREATSAYFLQHKDAPKEPTHSDKRAAQKAAQRAETSRLIASGQLTRENAQERNAPIHTAVRIAELWPAIRRHLRKK